MTGSSTNSPARLDNAPKTMAGLTTELFADDSTGDDHPDSPKAVSRRNLNMAGWAAAALRAYLESAGQPSTGKPVEAIGDLLGDLRHLCDALGVDFAAADKYGRERYCDELVSWPDDSDDEPPPSGESP